MSFHQVLSARNACSHENFTIMLLTMSAPVITLN